MGEGGNDDHRTIPTVDISPFLGEEEDGERRRTEVLRIVGEACRSVGFFRISNHGVPAELLKRALDLSAKFFAGTDEEKKAAAPSPETKSPLPTGYMKQPEHSQDKNEYLILFDPNLGFNVYPSNPPDFREVLDECFRHLTKTAELVEEIVNDSMGLPANFLKEYNKDRSSDFFIPLRYFPSTTDTEENGLSAHEDGNCITFVFQDDVGGLEVLNDAGEWIAAEPVEDTIIVNIGDVYRVLSNNRIRSATHRVVRKKQHRHSLAFFYNLDGEKWVEPLPKFTTAVGEPPRFRGFLYKEYLQLRMRNKTHPPENPEDAIHITHYAI